MLSRRERVGGAKDRRGDKTSAFHKAVRHLALIEAEDPENFDRYCEWIVQLAERVQRMRR